MLCDYYDAGACVSCTQLPVPYTWQLAQAQAECRATLATVPQWLDPVGSTPFHFRNKAKLSIGGTTAAPTLGILDGTRRGVDLRHCPLHERGIEAALPIFAEFITRAGLVPYDVPSRSGELKFLIVTRSPDGDLMARFVLRTAKHIEAIREHLPWLRTAIPHLAVASVNLHPEHKAVLEGEVEIVLTEQATLPMRLGDLTLHLHPRSFFQTNTAVASALYSQARDWLAGSAGPRWDLYCGVGGFALHLADPLSPTDRVSPTGRVSPTDSGLLDPATSGTMTRGTGAPEGTTTSGSATPGSSVIGVEISSDAIDSARRSAAEAGLHAVFAA